MFPFLRTRWFLLKFNFVPLRFLTLLIYSFRKTGHTMICKLCIIFCRSKMDSLNYQKLTDKSTQNQRFMHLTFVNFSEYYLAAFLDGFIRRFLRELPIFFKQFLKIQLFYIHGVQVLKVQSLINLFWQIFNAKSNSVI